MENYPKWYQSSAGPNLSQTIQGVVASFMPVINLILGSFGHGAIENATVNALVSSIIFVGTCAYTVYGYVRAKKVFGEKVKYVENELAGLRAKNEELAGRLATA